MNNAKLYGRTINWEEIPAEDVRAGVSRRVYTSDAVMLVRNTVEEGHEARPHRHDFDQLVQIDDGRCDYYVSGEAHPMGPGDLMLVPAGAEHYIAVTEGPCINIDVFAPPRADYADLIADPAEAQ
jgi:quercetin dioxygenase-like cupin family protein